MVVTATRLPMVAVASTSTGENDSPRPRAPRAVLVQ